MTFVQWIQSIALRIRHRLRPIRTVRTLWLKTTGMQIGRGSTIGRVRANWPQQVRVGGRCNVLDDVVFDYCHGRWHTGPSIVIGDRCYVGRGADFNCRVGIKVGNDCLIAAGCRLIDHDHGMALDAPMHAQAGPEAAIELEDDVWLGANVIVLKGVTIGRGAVVAAGAVVRQSIPAYEIWGGVPAKRIGLRTGKPA